MSRRQDVEFIIRRNESSFDSPQTVQVRPAPRMSGGRPDFSQCHIEVVVASPSAAQYPAQLEGVDVRTVTPAPHSVGVSVSAAKADDWRRRAISKEPWFRDGMLLPLPGVDALTATRKGGTLVIERNPEPAPQRPLPPARNDNPLPPVIIRLPQPPQRIPDDDEFILELRGNVDILDMPQPMFWRTPVTHIPLRNSSEDSEGLLYLLDRASQRLWLQLPTLPLDRHLTSQQHQLLATLQRKAGELADFRLLLSGDEKNAVQDSLLQLDRYGFPMHKVRAASGCRTTVVLVDFDQSLIGEPVWGGQDDGSVRAPCWIVEDVTVSDSLATVFEINWQAL